MWNFRRVQIRLENYKCGSIWGAPKFVSVFRHVLNNGGHHKTHPRPRKFFGLSVEKVSDISVKRTAFKICIVWFCFTRVYIDFFTQTLFNFHITFQGHNPAQGSYTKVQFCSFSFCAYGFRFIYRIFIWITRF